ncbi:hypothetical protein SAMN05428995_1176 [Loktanella sp. DSM 29012]|nr:hypothetical protein SAMN05428995_1176 [Loktanella sp. DSM 29012]
MLHYINQLFLRIPNRRPNTLRCDPWSIVFSVIAILLLMVRCDG